MIGIYGVVSYSVAQRTQEIGVRMALGATAPRRARRMVVGQARRADRPGRRDRRRRRARTLGPGADRCCIEVSPRDPLTIASIAALLIAVGVLASVVPARRATRVDPLSALRAE